MPTGAPRLADGRAPRGIAEIIQWYQEQGDPRFLNAPLAKPAAAPDVKPDPPAFELEPTDGSA